MENAEIVSKAFGKQSVVFDDIYDSNPIVGYMRDLIRKEVINGLNSDSHILEINAGTGTDALFFAQEGYKVTALEISPEMVKKANEKIRTYQFEKQINFLQGSYECPDKIEGEFDYLYSNFGGLNCTPNMVKVVSQLMDKLKPGGKATLTILPPITLWEKLYALKGDFKLATRRKTSGPSTAHIEGEYFECWYYNPSEIIKSLKGSIKDISVTGLCIFTPPSFMEYFPARFPYLFRLLTRLDRAVAKLPIFNRIGDYFMITFTKV
ncbi:MAG: class I SAM-dependent methyltransferase [Reichenbachiella sp.]|uniref:class I SAM-dependent methyltransferase n=1 Tax=Reichenbachiella sp. TaxID=2184521 RepID=UPI003265F728